MIQKTLLIEKYENNFIVKMKVRKNKKMLIIYYNYILVIILIFY